MGWQAVGAADFYLRAQADFREEGGEVDIPVSHGRLMSGMSLRQVVAKPEGPLREIEVLPVANDEIHRHIQGIFDVVIKAGSRIVEEREQAGAVRIGSRPDFAARGQETARLAFKER